MSTGKIAAQCGHAVEYLVTHTPKLIMREYRHNAHPKIVLQVSSLEELESIKYECNNYRIQNYMVEDAGLTQIPAGSFTILGIGPVRKENVPWAVSALKLL